MSQVQGPWQLKAVAVYRMNRVVVWGIGVAVRFGGLLRDKMCLAYCVTGKRAVAVEDPGSAGVSQPGGTQEGAAID